MATIVIMIGSGSDKDIMEPCCEVLSALGIAWSLTISSAHRSPERTEKIIREAEAGDARIFICAAGMAAHLAGAVAARTILPVIGVPISGKVLGGQDALYSTVQMPPGVPVATMALDKAGAKNAAWLAAEILAISDRELASRLKEERQKMARAVEAAAQELTGTLWV